MRRLTHWLTSGKSRPAKTHTPRARLAVWPLEPREVPAAVLANGVLTVTGDDPGIGDADTIEILSPVDGQMIVRVNGQQQFSGSTAISRVEIDGRAGVDTLAIRGVQSGIADGVRVLNSEIVGLGEFVPGTGVASMSNIRSSVGVERAGILNLLDTASTANRTVSVGTLGVTGLAPVPIGYNLGPEGILTIRTGSGADTFDVGGTPQALTRFFGGAGADTFDVQRTTGNVQVTGEAGVDEVTIGSVAVGFGETLGRVRVTDGSFQDRVTIHDDTAAATADFFTSYQATLTADRLDVRVVAAAQLGNRFIPVGFNRTIDLDRVGRVDYRAPTAEFPISQIDIRAVNRFTEVRVDAGGTALVNLGSTARTLDGIIGRVAVTGGLADSRLRLDDAGSFIGRAYRVGAGNITLPAPQIGQRDIGYADFLGAVDVQAGSGNDQFRVVSLRADDRSMRLDGNGGADSLTGLDQANDWALASVNFGSLNDRVVFQSMDTLVGRSGDDTFRFGQNGRVSGRIDGGGGFDTLDYSARTTGVTVNLVSGAATGVAGGVTRIRNVFGGSAADTLIGDGLDNVLVGNQGGDAINGGIGGRDLLIGGTGGDILRKGGGGDTIYIGGDVASGDQNNVASMKAVMDEWLLPTDVPSRLANLVAGVGQNDGVQLNPAALDGDVVTDTYVPNAGRDVFFRELLDVFQGNFLPGPTEFVVTV